MPSFKDLPSLLVFHQLYVTLEQLQRINDHFGSLAGALEAGVSDWRHARILKPAQLEKLSEAHKPALLQARDEALKWGNEDDQFWISWQDSAYPDQLLSIDEPPPILGVRGDPDWLTQPQIAIVGSRNASRSGLDTAKDFARFLSENGLTVTSGLALGIDAAAHSGGLMGQSKTIAVVATGLDRIYPALNQNLGRRIAEEGAMVSEFPLGTRPLAFRFPLRNRIISGLSYGVLVVEAALKSGSLITARTAMEQGREVFAVPGSIHNPQAKGCHQLIKQGAKLVESGQDIFEELANLLPQSVNRTQEKSRKKGQSVNDTGPEDSRLLQWIEYEPIGLDELAVLSKMPVSQIQADLMLLELSGRVEKLSAGRWRRLS